MQWVTILTSSLAWMTSRIQMLYLSPSLQIYIMTINEDCTMILTGNCSELYQIQGRGVHRCGHGGPYTVTKTGLFYTLEKIGAHGLHRLHMCGEAGDRGPNMSEEGTGILGTETDVSMVSLYRATASVGDGGGERRATTHPSWSQHMVDRFSASTTRP